MSPFGYILPLLGWVLLVFIVFIIALVITGIIQWITQSLKKRSGKKHIGAFVTENDLLSPDELHQEIKVEALKRYKHSEEHIVAFVSGAEFMVELLCGKGSHEGQ